MGKIVEFPSERQVDLDDPKYKALREALLVHLDSTDEEEVIDAIVAVSMMLGIRIAALNDSQEVANDLCEGIQEMVGIGTLIDQADHDPDDRRH